MRVVQTESKPRPSDCCTAREQRSSHKRLQVAFKRAIRAKGLGERGGGGTRGERENEGKGARGASVGGKGGEGPRAGGGEQAHSLGVTMRITCASCDWDCEWPRHWLIDTGANSNARCCIPSSLKSGAGSVRGRGPLGRQEPAEFQGNLTPRFRRGTGHAQGRPSPPPQLYWDGHR